MGIQASPQGTYGAKIPGGKFLKRLFVPLAKWQIASYRRSGGGRMTRMTGFPVVLLTTTGAKSGLPGVATLGGFRDGEHDGHQVDDHLVEQAGAETLLRNEG